MSHVYGYNHKVIRAALLAAALEAELSGGPKICHLCGEPLLPSKQQLHLDHTADRKSYRGLAHAKCNTSDGAKRGNKKRRRRNSRKW